MSPDTGVVAGVGVGCGTSAGFFAAGMRKRESSIGVRRAHASLSRRKHAAATEGDLHTFVRRDPESRDAVVVAVNRGKAPMNFINAAIQDGGATIAASKFSLPVPASLRPVTAAHDGRKVMVGIRPEHILEPSTPTRGEKATLEAEVEVIEPLGDEVIVHARVGEDLLVYKVEPQLTPEVGQKLVVAVELDRLHLFDTENEKRLGA